MEDEYSLSEVNICTMKEEIGGYRPNLYEYRETRLCVIDLKQKIAIDINHELMYDYLETINGSNFKDGANKKIQGEKRYAIFPLYYLGKDLDYFYKAESIIKKLKSGYRFKDGNLALSNEEYLRRLDQEKQKESGKRRIKIFKRK